MQQAYLKASNPGFSDRHGYAVAISGDTMVVGAPSEASNATGVDGTQSDDSAPGAGAAYVFVRSGSSWTQQAYLKASNTESGDNFGSAVAISGDTLVVGAHREYSSATGVNGDQADNTAGVGTGAAYVFVRSGSSWTQQAYLKASNTEGGDSFATSVSVSGDTVLIGAPFEDSNASGVNGNQLDNSVGLSGAAYVFVRNGAAWSQQAYLKASNSGISDYFGQSVCVSGDIAVVGAYGENSTATGVDGDQVDNSLSAAGAAYVFERNGTSWSQQAYLKASNTGANDMFGHAVAVAGETLVVGAVQEDSEATGVNGNQGDSTTSSESGAAYVFERSGGVWSQAAYLKASNWTTNSFGWSVAASGDTVLVGAPHEVADSAGRSGAAYTFVRGDSGWTQQLRLGPGDGNNWDWFGSAVSLSGDTAAVGAHQEDSAANGVNGDESDGSLSASGAAYAFALDQPWTNLGQGKVGGLGMPLLSLDASLESGSVGSIDLINAAGFSPAALFIGFTPGSVPALGGTFVPFPAATQLLLTVGPSNARHLPLTWPAGIPAGTLAYLQYLIQDNAATLGVAFSNAIELEAQ
ncbi:MAG: hypothetical protein DHS20C15_32180 [Planctomycetota bacterium]|nr:MAG: hypothetical protein DHS20C15_32180 [Planctomycetota bacterium]